MYYAGNIKCRLSKVQRVGDMSKRCADAGVTPDSTHIFHILADAQCKLGCVTT